MARSPEATANQKARYDVWRVSEDGRAWFRDYYQAHKDEYAERARNRLRDAFRAVRMHGITGPEYLAMLEKQNGGCATCGTPPRDGRLLSIDHDHACCPSSRRSCGGCIRGLLCDRCNRTLGLCHDDPGILSAMSVYLTERGK